MKNKIRNAFILALILFIAAGYLFLNPSFAEEGFKKLIKHSKKKGYSKHGWNHYGPGYFTLDSKTGVLQSHGGMGLFWYSKKYKDFILELDYKCDLEESNSGIFFRVPEMLDSNKYISRSFEIQICDSSKGNHKTGALFDAKAPIENIPTNGPGKWNHFRITCKGKNITIELNGKVINEWKMTVPSGKIKKMYPEGYIGLQNHDDEHHSSAYFKNIKIKKL